jgi:hypothetical protein
MTQDQIPSLELELRSAVALLESPVPIRTSMPLAGLIGRKMGVGRLDVLTELKNRNLWHILGVILNHLGPEDVHRSVKHSWWLNRATISRRQTLAYFQTSFYRPHGTQKNTHPIIEPQLQYYHLFQIWSGVPQLG